MGGRGITQKTLWGCATGCDNVLFSWLPSQASLAIKLLAQTCPKNKTVGVKFKSQNMSYGLKLIKIWFLMFVTWVIRLVQAYFRFILAQPGKYDVNHCCPNQKVIQSGNLIVTAWCATNMGKKTRYISVTPCKCKIWYMLIIKIFSNLWKKKAILVKILFPYWADWFIIWKGHFFLENL